MKAWLVITKDGEAAVEDNKGLMKTLKELVQEAAGKSVTVTLEQVEIGPQSVGRP